jgi:hypothetical protein
MTVQIMSDELIIYHPETGEVYEHIDQDPPERLAELGIAIRERIEQLKGIQVMVDAELRRRLEIKKKAMVVFGDFEVQYTPGRESVWDAEALEIAMGDLVNEGVLTAGELTGVIKREPEVVRSKANALLGRLTGAARASVESCRTWRDRRTARLVITRSAQLVAPPDSNHPDPAYEEPTW